MAVAVENLGFLKGAKEPIFHRALLWMKKDWGYWQLLDSSFDDYVNQIATVRGRIPVKAMIESHLQESKARMGLDVAGGIGGKALRQLIGAGLLRGGLVTNYNDGRSPEVRQDSRVGHVEGNLTRPDTWRRIIDWQRQNAPEGFGLVMHRPCGGLQTLNQRFYEGATHQLLDMMSPGGMFYAQIPFPLSTNMEAGRSTWDSLAKRGDIEHAWLASTNGAKLHPWNAHVLMKKR